jgi:hypothetical protein
VAKVSGVVEHVRNLIRFAKACVCKFCLVVTAQEHLALAGKIPDEVYLWEPNTDEELPGSLLFIGTCEALAQMRDVQMKRTVDLLIVSILSK